MVFCFQDVLEQLSVFEIFEFLKTTQNRFNCFFIVSDIINSVLKLKMTRIIKIESELILNYKFHS